MTNGVVLVTGASGTVGRPLAAVLAAGQQVRPGVHDPERAKLPAGVELVRLDFLDPATAGPAVVDVDRMFLMRPPAISDVTTALGPLVVPSLPWLRVDFILPALGRGPSGCRSARSPCPRRPGTTTGRQNRRGR